LVELASARRRKLVETKKLFEFHREVEDVETWIVEKTAVAGSEDYGTDIEHVQVQICCHFIIQCFDGSLQCFDAVSWATGRASSL